MAPRHDFKPDRSQNLINLKKEKKIPLFPSHLLASGQTEIVKTNFKLLLDTKTI